MGGDLVLGLLVAAAAICWVAVAAPEVPAVGRWLARHVHGVLRVDRVRVDLAQADLRWMSAARWLTLRWGLSALAGVVGYLLFGLPVLGLVASLAAYHLAGLWLESRRRRVEARRQRALLDAVRFGVSVMSRAGAALQMLRSLSETGPSDARPIFRQLLADAGSDQADALIGAVSRMRERLADPLFDDIALVLMLHWRRGGKLVPALEVLAADWSEMLSLHREAKALRAGVEASVLLLTMLPFAFLFLIRLLAQPLLEPFGRPLGEVVLALCVAWMVLGYRVLQRLSDAPREERMAIKEGAL